MRGGRDMQGLLVDVHLHGRPLDYLCRLLAELDLLPILEAEPIRIATFDELQIPRNILDRDLWRRCQTNGWVLLTENRNNEDEGSLHATLSELWQPGHLPVLTLSNKAAFLKEREYAGRVAEHIADLLIGIKQEEFLDQPRIFVPR